MSDKLLERSKQNLFIFTRNPEVIGHAELSDDRLLWCYFEHCAREIIREFFQILLALSKDELEHYRTFSLNFTQECMRCWQMAGVEQAAVSLISNKFGDKTRKVQCQAITTLVKVVYMGQRQQDDSL